MPTFTPHSSSRVMRGADPSPPDAAVNAAARAGDVEKVIALVDAGAAIGAWTTSCAAASGSLALLRELVDHRGCAMDEKWRRMKTDIETRRDFASKETRASALPRIRIRIRSRPRAGRRRRRWWRDGVIWRN